MDVMFILTQSCKLVITGKVFYVCVIELQNAELNKREVISLTRYSIRDESVCFMSVRSKRQGDQKGWEG
jgi:hypothetical protein